MRRQDHLSVSLVLLVLLLNRDGTLAQLFEPTLPERFQPKQYDPLFEGINQCAYKEVTQEGGGSPAKAWICGVSPNGKSGRIVYDCCPGFVRSTIVSNECVEKDRTYMPIIGTIASMNRQSSADLFEKALPALERDDGQDYTVFLPENEQSLQKMPQENTKLHIADGRHYSNTFKNGATIKTRDGYPLKVSTYPNGLEFVECQLLTKPDHETTNGIIHEISGNIGETGTYPSILQRLQNDPDASAFVADMPSDIQRELASVDGNDRYTVLVPGNAEWQTAKRGISGKQAVDDLVRQHVLDGLTCGLSIDQEGRLVGPSKTNSWVRAVQKPDGSRVMEDVCGKQVNIKKMDLMSGNGAVFKLDNALQSIGAMDLNGALNCLSNAPKNELSEAASRMVNCRISVSQDENAVVLLPTNDALKDPSVSNILSRNPCQVYEHHVLSSRECKMRNGKGIGVPQECKYTSKYNPSGGGKPVLANQYHRTREGSKIHFGQAKTTGVKPVQFRDGVIYPVSTMNRLPTQTMTEIIKGNPETSETFDKMQKAGFSQVLGQHSPNVVFLAPQNHGWKTREKENNYGSSDLRKLFEMHTIPHQLLTGPSGNIPEETAQMQNSVSGKKIKIKRNIDGSTFVGYDGLDPKKWTLALGEPIMATDGVVWNVDWPLVCDTC